MEDVEMEDERKDIQKLSDVLLETESSVPSPNISDAEQINKIEKAIEMNRLLESKLRNVAIMLNNKLVECRKKLNICINSQKKNTQTRNKRFQFQYTMCVKPYFKDAVNDVPPDNDDTIVMKNSSMLDYYSIHYKSWTLKDKNCLTRTIHIMSLDKRRRELLSQRQHYVHLIDSEVGRYNLKKCEKQLDELAKLNLKDVALPIDKDYDWNLVSKKLNNKHSPLACSAMWKLYLHPSINKSSWSELEKSRLLDIAVDHKCENWDQIAKELNTSRTGYQCFVYFRINLAHKLCKNKWTSDEDEFVRRLVNVYRNGDHIPWNIIARFLESKTKAQIYDRWHSSILPGLKKGRFLPEEDSLLLSCVQKFGMDFKKISTIIEGRNARQLRVRYKLLDKNTSAVWTVEEDRRLLQLMALQGSNHNYSSVVPNFPGKNRSNIRMRYLTLIKWTANNPDQDLILAPRSGPRRLGHGRIPDGVANCDYAKTVHITKKAEINLFGSIIVLATNELREKRRRKALDNRKNFNIVDDTTPLKLAPHIVLSNLMFLFRAVLDRNVFEQSQFAEKYKMLLLPKKRFIYSKKDTVTVVETSSNVRFWGKPFDMFGSRVLPPNFSSIITCRNLLLQYLDNEGQCQKSFTNMCVTNENFRQQWHMLTARYQIIFIWPLILSNKGPNVDSFD